MVKNTNATKRRKTFDDLIVENFISESDSILLRNILIDSNILIYGNKNTGLPLLLAKICELCMEEMGFHPLMIYTHDSWYSQSLYKARNEELGRVIFQGISNINYLFECESVIKTGNPTIVCIDKEDNVLVDTKYFDYIITLSPLYNQAEKTIVSISPVEN